VLPVHFDRQQWHFHVSQLSTQGWTPESPTPGMAR
jgi:hypothetical protein